MGLCASPWSIKGSYGNATRVRSALAWPPSGEAVDDAQHGGERSLTTRLDGRILTHDEKRRTSKRKREDATSNPERVSQRNEPARV